LDSGIGAATKLLEAYSKYSIRVLPANLLTGDITNRKGEITLVGRKSDDLDGKVKRKLVSDINRFFWENPLDVDDTRLVFEAEGKGAEYSEKKDGTAKLVLKIKVGLAEKKPKGCC